MLLLSGVLPGGQDRVQDVLGVGAGDVLGIDFLLDRPRGYFGLLFASSGHEHRVRIFDQALGLVEVGLRLGGLGGHSETYLKYYNPLLQTYHTSHMML